MSSARLMATTAFPILTGWALYPRAPMLTPFAIAALLEVRWRHPHEAWVHPRAWRQ
jgi:hypothetical protein